MADFVKGFLEVHCQYHKIHICLGLINFLLKMANSVYKMFKLCIQIVHFKYLFHLSMFYAAVFKFYILWAKNLCHVNEMFDLAARHQMAWSALHVIAYEIVIKH